MLTPSILNEHWQLLSMFAIVATGERDGTTIALGRQSKEVHSGLVSDISMAEQGKISA